MALAATGGLTVLRGHWLEFKGGKERDLHRSRELIEHGERWVMVGVIFEIIVAITFAAKEGCEARNTALEIAKNDPRKQPVVSLSGYAQFERRPKIPLKNDGKLFSVAGATNMHLSNDKFRTNFLSHVFLELGTNGQSETKFPLSRMGVIGSMSLSTHEGDSNFLRYDVYFDGDNSVINPDGITTEEINVLRIVGNLEAFGDSPLEVISGRVELMFNSSLPRVFGIPQQTNIFPSITSVVNGSTFTPYGEILLHRGDNSTTKSSSKSGLRTFDEKFVSVLIFAVVAVVIASIIIYAMRT